MFALAEEHGVSVSDLEEAVETARHEADRQRQRINELEKLLGSIGALAKSA